MDYLYIVDLDERDAIFRMTGILDNVYLKHVNTKKDS